MDVNTNARFNNKVLSKVQAFNSGTSAAFALSDGLDVLVTLTGNWVPAAGWPAGEVGLAFSLLALQDGTGNRTITFPSTVKFAGGVAPVLTATAGKADLFHFRCFDGTNWIATSGGKNF